MLLTLTQQIKRFNKFKASAGSNMQQNSYIAWEGNSLIDDSPIVLILTAILEQLGIPYTGGDATVKILTLNKDFLKP